MNAWEGDKTEFTSPSVNRTINAWESNKEELPPPNLNASIDLPSTSSLPEVEKTPIETDDIVHKKPSLPRFILRIWQFFAAIGAFAFQVGASPYSGEPIPFEHLGLLYYGYVICWISVIWSSFHVFVYFTRRFGQGKKVKRFINSLFDLVLAALFGVCVFYEIATYKCKPGLHNGWCDFYNTSLFFFMSLFLTYVVHALWDIFGAMSCLRS